MTLNLIGLIRASKINEAREQGFRNYVKDAGTGVKMTDYVVTSLSIAGASPLEFNEIPPFTNVTLTATYVAGNKVPSIFDPNYEDLVTAIVGSMAWDVVPPSSATPYIGPWVQLRSFTHTPTTSGGTIVAVLTLNNWAEYTGTLPPPGSSYRLFLPVAVTFRPEPHFNLRRNSEYVQYTVLPQVQGQPSPNLIYAAQFTGINDAGTDWVDLGTGQFRKGDEIYGPDPLGTGNFKLVGYRLRSWFPDSSWVSQFNNNYFTAGLQIQHSYETRLPDLSWAPSGISGTYTSVNSPTNLSGIVYGTPGQSFTMRCKTQVIAPFTSPMGISPEFSFTVQDKMVGPGGGPQQ